ncbi:Protein of unknown function [Tistlia consotensis]|uniref:Terpene utilization protein AtuA n=1 Tax=Tistlia consotensis USBA 355 TaxID=560819 RepID=A0A1Y6BDL5_9PROT|nr:acyclic terpene utilization AtuA family protein [Tistlia consotensis]SMF04566.1 Protein of unknown function [Tistlia consotensis USBA 355]SNR54585.1 Protein of unknown function [Tistlia consotensis]
MRELLRIGGGAGFWGDSPEGPAQLVRSGGIDVLLLDYLAEITLSIMARMKARRPEAGYATDFVDLVMAPLAREIAARGIKVVTNAGGVNPEACRDALQRVLDEAGVSLKIALVRGDDLSGETERLRALGVREMFTGAALPERLASVNAYLGAFPIARALAAGADVVITGRCVDSALALGPLIEAFGWGERDYDRLAAGSLAGHLIECSTQATGGIFTDWRTVEGWDRMGYPIAECRADGGFELTKPAGTGGLVAPATVAEQLVYEIGDPAAYLLPDVACDFSAVRLEQAGPDRVRVSGARGRPPTGRYKVSATWPDGYRAAVTMMIGGREAAAKARRVAEAILARVRRQFAEAGFGDFAETLVEVLGAESTYGPNARVRAPREVVLKLAVRHPRKEALQLFAREIYPAASAMAQGLTGFAGGRPEPQPVIRLFSFLIDRAEVPAEVLLEGRTIAVEAGLDAAGAPPAEPAASPAPAPSLQGPWRSLPLIAIAHGRSGDKGDLANIGVIARRPEFLPAVRRSVTPEVVAAWLGHLLQGPVERFDWPGIDGVNLVLHRALGGGGVASLRHDPQGKALAQMLLDLPVEVPAAWLEAGGPLAGWRDEEAGEGPA